MLRSWIGSLSEARILEIIDEDDDGIGPLPVSRRQYSDSDSEEETETVVYVRGARVSTYF